MELIKISQSQLKIMLTSEDMDRFELDCISAENNTYKARTAFRNILAEAKIISGFDAGNDKVFIQLYPSKQGGCEMYVSKTEFSADDSPSGEEYEYLPDKCEEKAEMKRDGYCAYRFPTLCRLISACRELQNLSSIICNSTLWIDENNRYHLLIKTVDGQKSSEECIDSAVSEYGDSENHEIFLVYIDEHGKELRRDDAVKVIADL